MAEGDTVRGAADRLDHALRGKRLVTSDLRFPSVATVDLAGQVVTDVVPRGKHLLVRTDAGLTVHSHLGMDGSWTIRAPGERWRVPTDRVRAVLRTDDVVAIGARLRRLDVWRTAGEAVALGHLGPDPLGPDWDRDEALRRLVADPGRPVGELVGDQRVMAGPGNVYRSEVCFLAGVDPRTAIGEVDDPERVVDLTVHLMQANRAGGRRVTTGDPRPGRELWVYGRRRRPCRRCGTLIVSFEQRQAGAARITYVCPRCQRRDPG